MWHVAERPGRSFISKFISAEMLLETKKLPEKEDSETRALRSASTSLGEQGICETMEKSGAKCYTRSEQKLHHLWIIPTYQNIESSMQV
jgi:hypothetical protein